MNRNTRVRCSGCGANVHLSEAREAQLAWCQVTVGGAQHANPKDHLRLGVYLCLKRCFPKLETHTAHVRGLRAATATDIGSLVSRFVSAGCDGPDLKQGAIA